jgi:phosphatidylglycerophosphatase A
MAGTGRLGPGSGSGTLGSLWGLLAGWVLWRALGPWGVAAAAVLVTAVGTWAAEATARHLGRRDPGEVVIDEVAGQLFALLFLPPTVGVLLLAFLLFRLFDIWKPFPIRRLERWPGGLGIMADDVLAGVYANLALRVALLVVPVGWTS